MLPRRGGEGNAENNSYNVHMVIDFLKLKLAWKTERCGLISLAQAVPRAERRPALSDIVAAAAVKRLTSN